MEPLTLERLVKALGEDRHSLLSAVFSDEEVIEEAPSVFPLINALRTGKSNLAGADVKRSLQEWCHRALLESSVVRLQYSKSPAYMSNSECNNTECTYSQTGICLLNKNPDDCSNRIFSQEKEDDETEYSVLDPITSSAAEGEARFPPSAVLGMDDVRAVTRKEYCRLIGLLGTPGSGKTSCLVSLYLLLSQWAACRIFICG